MVDEKLIGEIVKQVVAQMRNGVTNDVELDSSAKVKRSAERIYRNDMCQVIFSHSENAYRVLWAIEDDRQLKENYVAQFKDKESAITVADAMKNVVDMFTSGAAFDKQVISKTVQTIAKAVRDSDRNTRKLMMQSSEVTK